MPTERTRPGLARDARGAVLVVGLFAAVFLVGLLYYVFGTGETIRHHERMNDAADAGAYDVAVMHARGMNLAALSNMIKLAVTATMTAYLAIITGAALTIAWIVSSYWRLIALGWTIPSLVAVMLQALGGYTGFQSDADTAIRATDALQASIRDDLPTIALLKADARVAAEYQPPALGLVRAPELTLELDPMPIREGSVMDLCQRAFPYSFGMVLVASKDVAAPVRGKFIGFSTAAILPHCLMYGVAPYEMSDSRLGGDAFQLRVAALGEPLPALGERGVRVAARGEPDGRAASVRDQISRLTVAQSEYYFDGPQDEDEMLWRMEWRARMRRWRLPGGDTGLGGLDGGYFHEVHR